LKSKSKATKVEETQKTTAITAQNHHASDNVLDKYIKNIGAMNKATAYEYRGGVSPL
jgi:hypothetical protein